MPVFKMNPAAWIDTHKLLQRLHMYPVFPIFEYKQQPDKPMFAISAK